MMLLLLIEHFTILSLLERATPCHVIYEKKEKIKIDYSGLNMSLQVNSLVKQVDQVVMFTVM